MNQDYYWLNDKSRIFLNRGYLENGQTPEDRIREIAESAERILGIGGFADKFESYMKRGWYSLSTPIWSNFGNNRGLSISCNGSYIPDTMDGILTKLAEVGVMTKNGAGTSAYFGDVRPRGSLIRGGLSGKTSGSVHFMQLFDCVTNVVSQSNVRRGSFAAYLPIEHPDFEEFLKIKSDGFPIQNISIGACISDDWMKSLESGDKDKAKLWRKVLQKKFERGYPYFVFTDNANNNAPQVYKDKGIRIHASNLCNEIYLSSSESESFVCNLSSLNLLHWDEWKDTDAVETMTYFLDAVMSDYIESVSKIHFMDSAYNFAVNQRALGIGVLGWHSYLQSKMIPLESMEAKFLNSTIFKSIREKSYQASRDMAIKYGEPPLLQGYGMRNVTTMAIAPTKSSSFILGQVSRGIEPNKSNYFVDDLAKGKFSYKNPYLKKLLKDYNNDTADIWKSILVRGGSVQHLDFLTTSEKDVFKTFGELSQMELVIQAAQRQVYIDQGQSLNLRISNEVSISKVSKLIREAWRLKLKGLYYQKGTNPAQKMNNDILTCSSCEG